MNFKSIFLSVSDNRCQKKFKRVKRVMEINLKGANVNNVHQNKSAYVQSVTVLCSDTLYMF